MNILHISPYYPDLEANHAGGVCMGKEIETLRERHEVRVLTFISQPFDEKLAAKHANDERYDYVRISRLTRAFHILAEPWMPNYFAARSSLRFALKLIKNVKKHHIDAIHAEYASMGQYLWIRKLFPEIRFNLTEHDMTVQSFERKLEDAQKHGSGWTGRLKSLYFADQLRKIRRHEERYCRNADVLFTLNEKDRRLIKEYYCVDKAIVLNPFCGLEDNDLNVFVDPALKQKGTICFLGQMGRPENNRAGLRLIEIAKQTRLTIPELQVYIIGNNPSEELRDRACRTNQDAGTDFIHVTGFAEDIDVYMKPAQLAVFPLDTGAGIKMKVLHALALGIPVVTGKVGAEGIDEDSQVILPAETDEEYAAAIQRMLKKPAEELLKAGAESQTFIRNKFSWEQSRTILRTIYT